jgi:hypothetical protein
VSIENAAGLTLSVLLLCYLVVALLFGANSEMSDTTAGLLQVGLLIAALAACYRPLGGYMAPTWRGSTPASTTPESNGSSTG